MIFSKRTLKRKVTTDFWDCQVVPLFFEKKLWEWPRDYNHTSGLFNKATFALHQNLH